MNDRPDATPITINPADILKEWAKLQQRYPSLIVYGAGKMTQHLLSSLKQNRHTLPPLVWDDNPSREEIQGTPVVKTPDEFPADIQAVLLGTDTFQAEMLARLQLIQGNRPAVIALTASPQPGEQRAPTPCYGNVCVAISGICNLNCRMCGSQQSQTNARILMEKHIFHHICDKIPTNWSIELNSLGEPTLHPDFLEFVERMVMERRHISVQTNGMWPSSIDSDRFMNLMGSAIGDNKNILHFSVDGGTRDTIEYVRRGVVYEQLIHNIREAIRRKNHATVGITYVVMQRTLPEILNLLKSLPGLDYLNLLILQVNSTEMLSESIYDKFEEYLAQMETVQDYCKKHRIELGGVHRPGTESGISGCNFPRNLWIDVEGKVSPCCRRSDLALGNIADMKLPDILAKGRRLTDLSNPRCNTCFASTRHWDWAEHFSTREYFNAFQNTAQRDKP